MPDGRWEWDVFYPQIMDDKQNWRDKDKSQYGYVDSLDEAFACIKKIVEEYGIAEYD